MTARIADSTPAERPARASERFANLVGLPAPAPFSAEQEAAYQQWMDDGDADLAAIIARRREPNAA
jgi:hypothetical protein